MSLLVIDKDGFATGGLIGDDITERHGRQLDVTGKEGLVGWVGLIGLIGRVGGRGGWMNGCRQVHLEGLGWKSGLLFVGGEGGGGWCRGGGSGGSGRVGRTGHRDERD